MNGGAFDRVRSLLLFAEETRATPGSGGLVVEDEVLVTADPAIVPEQEQGEVRVGAGEAEGDVKSLQGFLSRGRPGRRPAGLGGRGRGWRPAA
jgi:hypothetical protein